MYILNTAYCRQNKRNSRWVETDLTNTLVSTLATTYADVWFFITYLDVVIPKALRLSAVTNLLTEVAPTATVQEWLTNIGNLTLPFSVTAPEFNPKVVHYTNAWHAGYDIQPIDRGGVYNPVGSRYDKEDLRIIRSDVSPEVLTKHALFTVNGLFHMADYNAQGTYILGGNKSLILANDNQVGIYSFLNVGELQYVPITESMIRPLADDIDLYKGVYIHFPESIDTTNKTVLLVIGGYLHVLDNVYFPISDNAFRINPGNLCLLERIYDSYRRLDLSPLGLVQYEENSSLIETESLLSDDVIKAYLTLEQSFFIVVDCESFFKELIPLDPAGTADRYIDFTQRFIPVIGCYGRMVEHHRIHEDGLYVVAGSSNQRYHYHFHTYDWTDYPGVDAGLLPANPYSQGMAYLQLMGTEK